MRIETLAVHAAAEADEETRAVAPPIHLSTTFEHPPDTRELDGYLYSRYRNPTQDRLERALAALEGGSAALVYASGMAAAAALFTALPAGHLLLADDTYFSVRTLARDLGARCGLETTLVDATRLDRVREAMRPTTRCLWIETPSNPHIRVSDIAGAAELARAAGAILVVDSTFATPILQQPLALGAHVVLHSLTKYMGGHSDVQGGALILAAEDDLHRRLAAQRTVIGAVASPMSSWLVLRGLRTLACRMEWHCRAAHAVATALAAHPAVSHVHYPGLPQHPQHPLARAQMYGFGGMLSFRVRGGRDAALAVAGRLSLFRNATSLGSTESLVEHRESVEGPDSPTEPDLLRLSVGLEHPDDLVEDLLQALEGG
jgi:cystathionine gamma-synthase